MSALDKQIAGGHYKDMAIQPVEFCMLNNLDYCQANVIKYVCRFRDKNGIQDLDKAIHYIELLKEFYEQPTPEEFLTAFEKATAEDLQVVRDY